VVVRTDANAIAVGNLFSEGRDANPVLFFEGFRLHLPEEGRGALEYWVVAFVGGAGYFAAELVGNEVPISFPYIVEVHRMKILSVFCLIACAGALVGCQTGPDHAIQSEAMFREYFETWNTHDLDTMLSYFTDDCVYENLARQQTYHGKSEIEAWAKAAFKAIPDFKLEIRSLFVSGEWVACEWVMTGTPVGGIPNLPATPGSFSVRGSTIAQLKDGKILRNADYWDLATFMGQIGAM
jgi:steroid delta-isomerase-like uncharacterized protein